MIILGIKSFLGNPHDSKTIEPLLDEMASNLFYTPEEVVYDSGGKGQKKIVNIKGEKSEINLDVEQP